MPCNPRHGEVPPPPHDVEDALGASRAFLRSMSARRSIRTFSTRPVDSLHQAGLATPTRTPSPMRFLNAILDRPAIERPFVVIPAGHRAREATVPDVHRKELDQILVWLDDREPT